MRQSSPAVVISLEEIAFRLGSLMPKVAHVSIAERILMKSPKIAVLHGRLGEIY